MIGAGLLPSAPHMQDKSGLSKRGGREHFQGAIMTKALAAAAVLLICSSAGVRAQDLAAGETSFKKCLPCHAVGEGAKNKVGPLLNGLEGRKSGTIDGYSYSEAN